MDPNVTLAEALKALLLLHAKPFAEFPMREDIAEHRWEAGEKLQELGAWLQSGGFPPNVHEAFLQAASSSMRARTLVLPIARSSAERCKCGDAHPPTSPHPVQFEVSSMRGTQRVCSRQLDAAIEELCRGE